MIHIYIFAYILYTLVCYAIAIMCDSCRLKKRDAKILLSILIFVGALIAALRPENTQDIEVYNAAYQDCLAYLKNVKLDLKNIFANRSFRDIELFYVMIMAFFRRVFVSPIFFYLIQGFFSNAIMVQGLYLLCQNTSETITGDKDKYFSNNVILIYALYQTFCGILYTSSAIRDGLSISIGVFAIANLLLKRKRLLSCVFLLASVLIHTTSIVLIGIYLVLLVWKRKIGNCSIVLTSLFVPALYFLKVGAVLVGFITPLIEELLNLLNINAFYSYIKLLDYQLPMREGFLVVATCIILALLSISGKIAVKESRYIIVVIIGLLMFVSAYPIPALARLLYVFVLFMIPVVVKMKKNRKLVYVFWTLLFVPQYIYVFSYFL